MKQFRINYIDGHDLRYKSIEVHADSKEDALSALWDMYDADYDHQIVEVLPRPEKDASEKLRIGGTVIDSTPFTEKSRKRLGC